MTLKRWVTVVRVSGKLASLESTVRFPLKQFRYQVSAIGSKSIAKGVLQRSK